MKGPINRRAILFGGGIAAATGLAALRLFGTRLFGKYYPPTPYDDLLSQLADRDAAASVGSAVQAAGSSQPVRVLAHELRARLGQRTMRELVSDDITQNAMAEVKGWVLPRSVVLLCALAAEAR